ncbi:hypothetical protein AB0K80_19495 [Streptomyces sp. NPDC052682]|uniref:hypothetical protein n=1 Tax=Streptomyces sp. NPDC052682 TaxID=3154954 RepID=UPI0034332944
MFFRRRPRSGVRLILPRRRSRALPDVLPLPEDGRPEPVPAAEPDEDEIKVRERLLVLLGEAVRWPR